MKTIIFIAFVATLVSGFGLDFSDLQERAKRSVSGPGGYIDGLVPAPGSNKIKQIECKGHDFLAPNGTSYIRIPKGAQFGFHSTGEASNYPANYKCGTVFVSDYDSKLQIKCFVRITAGDYLTMVGQNRLEVFTNMAAAEGSAVGKIYREMQLPFFYLGFLSNNGGRKGFFCRIQETSGVPQK